MLVVQHKCFWTLAMVWFLEVTLVLGGILKVENFICQNKMHLKLFLNL